MKGLAIPFCVLGTIILSSCGLLLEEENRIVAKVGGEPIQVRELKEQIRGLPFEERAGANDVAEDVRIKARLQILQGMAVSQLILLEAEARGEVVSEEEIHAALTRQYSGQEGNEGFSQESQDVPSREHEDEGERYTDREIEEMRKELVLEKLTAMVTSDDAPPPGTPSPRLA
jgi:hypothetical protein